MEEEGTLDRTVVLPARNVASMVLALEQVTICASTSLHVPLRPWGPWTATEYRGRTPTGPVSFRIAPILGMCLVSPADLCTLWRQGPCLTLLYTPPRILLVSGTVLGTPEARDKCLLLTIRVATFTGCL